jgi:hypothetical protein
MKGKAKQPKTRAAFIRHVLAENVKKLSDAHFTQSRNKPRSLSQAAKKAGHTLSMSSVQRIMKGETGASLDNIQVIADLFDLSVYQLFVPALNIANPQVVQGAHKDEERMYRSFRRSREGEFAREEA